MSIKAFALAAIVAILAAVPAEASTVSRVVTFETGPFSLLAGSGTPPVGTASGSFSVSFDPSVNHIDETAGLTLISFALSAGSTIQTTLNAPLAFSYYSAFDRFVIGGLQNSVTTVNGGTIDFFAIIFDFLGAASFTEVVLGQLDQPQAVFSSTWSGTVSAVPLPGAALLLLSGIGGLAFFANKRRTRQNV